MLAILIARAWEDSQVNDTISHLVERGISILQYAYDTIIFRLRESVKHEAYYVHP
jgi:hypothetical protein